MFIGAVAIIVAAKEAALFLAITDPVTGGDLIVEGWAPDYAFDQAIVEFRRNQYGKMYVTGGPIEEGSTLCDHKTYAERGAAILRSKGLPADVVQAVSAPYVDRARTYASATALKNWQLDHGISSKSYHVMSVGPHARRTRLLFQEALGARAVVGITAIEDRSFDPKHWWSTSAGVRTVMSEAFAYVYFRCLF